MTASAQATVADLVESLDRRYPPVLAEQWDRVGLVLGDPSAPVTRVLLVVDCVPETVEEAVAVGAQLVVAHHPLLLRGVSSLAPTTYKGRAVHRLIRAGIALFTAHTNADTARAGVSDALADRLGLVETRPLRPTPHAQAAAAGEAGDGSGSGRIGRLPTPLTLTELTNLVAAVLPATAWGVRAAGDPDRRVETVAVCGGAGETYLADARDAGADAYLTADLRHHPASEYLGEQGPALLDAAHWATEQPWLDTAAAYLRGCAAVETVVSTINTDPWTLRASSDGAVNEKSPAVKEFRL